MSTRAASPTNGYASIVPVILSGGSGTRLWPLSRALYPKQFIPKLAGSSSTLIGDTFRRLPANQGFKHPLVLCNNDHRFLVEQELKNAACVASAIVLEPVQRNTAPAIAVAAVLAMRDDPDAVIVVMPSDHVVRNPDAFIEAVGIAAIAARNGRHILFGLKPSSPHTGFGYIKKGAPISEDADVFDVDSFVEKPDEATATKYLESGDYFWNSGIFVLSARAFLEDLQALQPDIAECAQRAVDGSQEDLQFLRLGTEAFARSPGISIDYAVMEKTALAAVMPLDLAWSDVGSWSSLWEVSPQDEDGNATMNSDALLLDSRNCLVHSSGTFVAGIGLDNLVIVETPDALLVADKSRAQEVGMIVQKLKSENRREHEQHTVNHRPWGFFETLSLGPRFQVKRLHVKPGGKLSMQMHHHRSEHWIVVEGTARVTIGDSEKLISENESIYIFATQWHRLENPGKVALEIIEVQIGSYLGEDDIIRGDDIYNRAPEETK